MWTLKANQSAGCAVGAQIVCRGEHNLANKIKKKTISECHFSERPGADQQDENIALHQPASQAVRLRCSGDTAAKTDNKNIVLLTHEI